MIFGTINPSIVPYSIELIKQQLEHYQTQLEHIPGRILGGNTLENMGKTQSREIFGPSVGRFGSAMVPFDKARRVLFETLSNSVGTRSWANRRWNYFGRVRGPIGTNQSWGFSGGWVWRFGSPMVPLDRARRFVSGILFNSVRTPS